MATKVPKGRYIPINLSGIPKKDSEYDLGGPNSEVDPNNNWVSIYAIIFDGVAFLTEWADIAEIFEPDQIYDAGTIVCLGGPKEITISKVKHDTDVFGVVSSDPAYVMNKGAEGIPVAMLGSTPCKVLGAVKMGDKIVSSHIPGVGEALPSALLVDSYYSVIGISIEDKDTTGMGLCKIKLGK